MNPQKPGHWLTRDKLNGSRVYFFPLEWPTRQQALQARVSVTEGQADTCQRLLPEVTHSNKTPCWNRSFYCSMTVRTSTLQRCRTLRRTVSSALVGIVHATKPSLSHGIMKARWFMCSLLLLICTFSPISPILYPYIWHRWYVCDPFA